jgi:hypothetical protein
MAAIPLNSFYEKLQSGGVQLQHQYQISFSNVPYMFSDGLETQITYWAEAFTLPSRTQETAKLAYLGYDLVIPTNMTMDQQFSLTIRCDKDMLLHRKMLIWQSNTSKAIAAGGKLDNMGGSKQIQSGELNLDLYDHEMKNALSRYTLAGVFPTKVGNIQFSNSNAAVAQFDCDFAFQYWYVPKGSYNGSQLNVTGI